MQDLQSLDTVCFDQGLAAIRIAAHGKAILHGHTINFNGNTVTANMLYAVNKTRFGASFNPAEITMGPWGTITLTYTDDDSINFAYNSPVAGFGVGNHVYVRITQPLGTKAVTQITQ